MQMCQFRHIEDVHAHASCASAKERVLLPDLERHLPHVFSNAKRLFVDWNLIPMYLLSRLLGAFLYSLATTGVKRYCVNSDEDCYARYACACESQCVLPQVWLA